MIVTNRLFVSDCCKKMNFLYVQKECTLIHSCMRAKRMYTCTIVHVCKKNVHQTFKLHNYSRTGLFFWGVQIYDTYQPCTDPLGFSFDSKFSIFFNYAFNLLLLYTYTIVRYQSSLYFQYFIYLFLLNKTNEFVFLSYFYLNLKILNQTQNQN